MVSLVTSCVNEGLQEPQDASALKMIPSLEEQTVAVEASMEELHELQAALESNDVKLEGMAAAEQQAAVISKGGASLEEGTLAAFELQKQIARILGPAVASLDSEIYESEFKERFDALELGISKWVGKDFASLYPAALAEAVTKAAVADLDGQLSRQKLYVDALASDVEAGLRNDEKPGELISLAASVQETAANSEKLASELTALASEVEEEYEAAVKSIISDPSGFDGAALKQFNSNVGVELASADNTLESLSARVAACEVQLSAILERLGSLETEIEDLEGLLEMVQSVTFMSKYSEDKAVAYYTMNVSGASDAQGRKPRTPDVSIELQYVVRPASAAAALTSSSMWNNGLKIFGYYAEAMTKAAGDFFDFNITKVTADQTTGIVTITVANALNSNFFFKETGAKIALSLVTGETDLTSKFVEIVPKDKSGTVYVEKLTLSHESLEVDNGLAAEIKATVTPSDATTGGVIWTSSNPDVLTVTDNGVVEGKAVGNAVITATTKGTDEWGNTISAQCNVKVNPAIKLSGPSYVEKGGNITIRIESPDYIDPETVTWTSSAPTLASITKSEDGSAVVSGGAMYYSTTDKAYTPITITCKIDGKATLNHEIRVTAVQPKGVAIEGLSSGQNTLTLKKGQEYTLNPTVQPAGVDMNLFRFRYQSNNTEVVNVPDMNSGKIVANAIGSATVSVKVTDQGEYNYFYPARDEYVRYVDVTVEPYWVTAIILPSTWEMKPGEEGSISAEFTSDGGENVMPTDMTLSWKSDNPSAVEIDAVNGKMTAKSVGTAVITATSTSVPSGSQPVTASCTVTVKEASAADPKVGDYYYSDGTWSTELVTGKTVIGVVFSTMNAIGDDSKLREEHPACSHGLVVSVKEVSSIFGGGYGWADQGNGNEMYPWLSSNYALANYSTTAANGYTATLGLKGYQSYRGADDCCQIVAVLNDSSLPSAPADKPNSGWYIPSYKEMQLLGAERASVNSAISKVTGGNQIGEGDYWTSSLSYIEKRSGNAMTGYKYFYDTECYPFNMTNNAWTETHQINTTLPVRVVLAF